MTQLARYHAFRVCSTAHTVQVITEATYERERGEVSRNRSKVQTDKQNRIESTRTTSATAVTLSSCRKQSQMERMERVRDFNINLGIRRIFGKSTQSCIYHKSVLKNSDLVIKRKIASVKNKFHLGLTNVYKTLCFLILSRNKSI